MYYLNENMFISKHETTSGKLVGYVATAPSIIGCFFSDPNPPATLDAKANDFIPYNTGDLNLELVRKLKNRKVIVFVSAPSEYLYKDDVKDSFVTVLNDYFNGGEYKFFFTIKDIYPASASPPSRER